MVVGANAQKNGTSLIGKQKIMQMKPLRILPFTLEQMLQEKLLLLQSMQTTRLLTV